LDHGHDLHRVSDGLVGLRTETAGIRSLLRLEDFAPKTGNLSTSLGLTYITQRDDAVDVGTVLSPLFPGVFIVLPNVQATEQEQDSVVGSLGLRYGLISRLNLTAQGNGTYRNVRTETAETIHTSETGRLTNVSLGMAYSQSKSTVANVNARVGIGGNNRTQLSMFVTHRFNQ